jgi:hypothetical protein
MPQQSPLTIDSWKRIGPNQMGQKCGRGWEGLKGACQRAKQYGSKEAARKASAAELATKIKAYKAKTKPAKVAQNKSAVNLELTKRRLGVKSNAKTHAELKAELRRKVSGGIDSGSRAAKLAQKEEKRALANLGENPGVRQATVLRRMEGEGKVSGPSVSGNKMNNSTKITAEVTTGKVLAPAKVPPYPKQPAPSKQPRVTHTKNYGMSVNGRSID